MEEGVGEEGSLVEGAKGEDGGGEAPIGGGEGGDLGGEGVVDGRYKVGDS
jgi:hypothetical protein